MKSFTSLQLAAAGIASLAAVAQAQSLCAVNCFQSVITEHPPLDCTEETMYLCFCKSTSLQGYFIDCAYDECANEAEDTVAFGVNLCSELGAPITVPARPTTTAAQETQPTSDPATTTSDVVETSAAAGESETSTEAEVEPTAAVTSSSGSEYPVASESGDAESTYAEHTYVEPSKSEVVPEVQPTPSGDLTTPPANQPSVVEAMGVNVMIAPGLLTGAAAVVAAFQLL